MIIFYVPFSKNPPTWALTKYILERGGNTQQRTNWDGDLKYGRGSVKGDALDYAKAISESNGDSQEFRDLVEAVNKYWVSQWRLLI